MATRYSMEILDAETYEWTPVALFSDLLPRETLQDMCRTMWDNVTGADRVTVFDMETGELAAEFSAVDEEKENNDS